MACARTDGYQTDRHTNTQTVRGGQEEFRCFFTSLDVRSEHGFDNLLVKSGLGVKAKVFFNNHLGIHLLSETSF